MNDDYSNYPTHDKWMASRYASREAELQREPKKKDISKAELLAAYDKLKKRTEKAKAPFIIQCPSSDCRNEDLDTIDLCESAITHWRFKIEGSKIVCNSDSQHSGDYDGSTRHLYCQRCDTEWKVPTLAEVDWV